MIKKLGTWLGIEHDNEVDAQESQTAVECKEGDADDDGGDDDGVTALASEDLTAHILQRAKGLGGNSMHHIIHNMLDVIVSLKLLTVHLVSFLCRLHL